MSLKLAGILCTAAENGQEALARLKENRYDLLLTDLRMPKMHGYDLIMQAIALDPPPLILVVSVLDDVRLVNDLIEKGAIGFLSKPVNQSVLVAYVKRFLAFAESGRAFLESQNELKRGIDSLQKHYAELVRELGEKRDAAEEGFKGSAEILSRLIEGREYFKDSHSGRVSKIACGIAKRLGLDADFIRHLHVASLLHQIGYLALPDEVLSVPPQDLDSESKEIFRRFPRLGSLLIKEMTDAADIAEMVEYHQERYDGSGYPDGLAGEKIPLGARILCLADSVVEYIYDRKTGVPRSKKEALEFAISGMNIKFDPSFLQAITAILQEAEPVPSAHGIYMKVSEIRLQDVITDNVFDKNGILLIGTDIVVTPFIRARIRSLSDFGKMPEMVKVRRA
jgi:response regulator RpfG family c-di-GMP phosphodiesterase